MRTVLNLSSIEDPVVAPAKGDGPLLANLARELRKQLKPIGEGALVLQRRDLDGEVARATARIIDRQGQALGLLIDELVDISEAQLGTTRLQRRRISMSSIVESCVQSLTPYLRVRGQRLEVRVSRESMELHADSARLCQALKNLIINAAELSEPGAVIQVRAERDDGDCMVVVSDDGPGIAASNLESIFQLHGTVRDEGASRVAGSGAGLYLARRFVEAHGGTLVATSAGVNRGSSFTLRIPCVGFYPEAAGFPNWGPSSRSVSALTTA